MTPLRVFSPAPSYNLILRVKGGEARARFQGRTLDMDSKNLFALTLFSIHDTLKGVFARPVI